jgi:hypothetical protein
LGVGEVFITKIVLLVNINRLHASSAARQSASVSYPSRGLFFLALAALAKAHMHALARRSEPKDHEGNFAKRTQLSHLKSVIYVFQKQRKHGNSGNI